MLNDARQLSFPWTVLPRQDKHTAAVSAERLGTYLVIAYIFGLGVLHAWADRYATSSDASSYFDIARHVVSGDLGELINGYWNPLYPLIIAAALGIFQPSPQVETLVIHLVVHVPIFVFAMATFHFFWSTIYRWAGQDAGDESASCETKTHLEPLPGWLWWMLGYAAFGYAGLRMVTIGLLGPDLLLMALMLWAFGLVLQIRIGDHRWKTFALLGLVCGAGYLTKTVMFVGGLVLITIAWASILNFSARPRQLHCRHATIALSCFLVLASLLIVPLSVKKGRPTFGDVGRLAYAWYVTGRDYHMHDEHGDNALFDWQHHLPGLGEPVHTKIVLQDDPRVNYFPTPIKGSYPFWYDPSYWYEGLEASFNPSGQVAAIRHSVLELGRMLGGQLTLALAALTLLIIARRPAGFLQSAIRLWAIWLPAIIGIGLFCLVLVLPRYVAPYAIVLWAVVFASIRIRPGAATYWWTKWVGGTAASVCLLALLLSSWPAISQTTDDIRWRKDTARNLAGAMTQQLYELGLKPGDEVAHIGKALKSWSFWASTSRIRMTAEFRPADEFWSASPAQQARYIDVFRDKTHCKAIVARLKNATDLPPGWLAVPRTDFYVYLLDPITNEDSIQAATIAP